MNQIRSHSSTSRTIRSHSSTSRTLCMITTISKNTSQKTLTWSKIVKHFSKKFHLSQQNDEITLISQKPISTRQSDHFINLKNTNKKSKIEFLWRRKPLTLRRRDVGETHHDGAGGREASWRKSKRNPSRRRRRTDRQRTRIDSEARVRQTKGSSITETPRGRSTGGETSTTDWQRRWTDGDNGDSERKIDLWRDDDDGDSKREDTTTVSSKPRWKERETIQVRCNERPPRTRLLPAPISPN